MLVQAILYGVYLATLAHCLRWFLYDGKGSEGSRGRTNRRVSLAVLVLVLLLETMSIGVRLAMAIEQTFVVRLHTLNVSR